MRRYKTLRDARVAYDRVRRTCGVPFGQWLYGDTATWGRSLDEPEDVAAFIMRYAYVPYEREHMFVVLLDSWHKPICAPVTVSEGMLNGTPAGAREVFAEAVWWQASAIVIAHNHPSGNCEPSRKDLLLTREIVSAGDVLRIPVLDHVIVSCYGAFVSIRRSNRRSIKQWRKSNAG